MTSLFISYRRNESEVFAGRLADHLEVEYGRDNVFLDIHKIPPSEDWKRVIERALRQSAVVLAIIGRRWSGAHVDEGRRIDDPEDELRRELELALREGKAVIPILMGDAPMPSSEELPEALKPLATIQALRVAEGEDFRHHVRGLIDAVDEALSASGGGATRPAYAVLPVRGAVATIRCQECQVPNPRERGYCLNCHASLYQKCPNTSCGVEEIASVDCCGACGIDIVAWRRADAHISTARDHTAAGEFGPAIDELQLARRTAPSRTEISALIEQVVTTRDAVERDRERALSLEAQDQLAPAEATWRRVLEQVPDSEEALERVASLAARLPRHKFDRLLDEHARACAAGRLRAAQELGPQLKYMAEDLGGAAPDEAEAAHLRAVQLGDLQLRRARERVERALAPGGDLQDGRRALHLLRNLKEDPALLDDVVRRLRWVSVAGNVESALSDRRWDDALDGVEELLGLDPVSDDLERRSVDLYCRVFRAALASDDLWAEELLELVWPKHAHDSRIIACVQALADQRLQDRHARATRRLVRGGLLVGLVVAVVVGSAWRHDDGVVATAREQFEQARWNDVGSYSSSLWLPAMFRFPQRARLRALEVAAARVSADWPDATAAAAADLADAVSALREVELGFGAPPSDALAGGSRTTAAARAQLHSACAVVLQAWLPQVLWQQPGQRRTPAWGGLPAEALVLKLSEGEPVTLSFDAATESWMGDILDEGTIVTGATFRVRPLGDVQVPARLVVRHGAEQPEEGWDVQPDRLVLASGALLADVDDPSQATARERWMRGAIRALDQALRRADGVPEDFATVEAALAELIPKLGSRPLGSRPEPTKALMDEAAEVLTKARWGDMPVLAAGLAFDQMFALESGVRDRVVFTGHQLPRRLRHRATGLDFEWVPQSLDCGLMGGFYAACTKVTNEAWDAVCPGEAADAAVDERGDQPRVRVSHGEASSYCNELNLCLPSPAEWSLAMEALHASSGTRDSVAAVGGAVAAGSDPIAEWCTESGDPEVASVGRELSSGMGRSGSPSDAIGFRPIWRLPQIERWKSLTIELSDPGERPSRSPDEWSEAVFVVEVRAAPAALDQVSLVFRDVEQEGSSRTAASGPESPGDTRLYSLKLPKLDEGHYRLHARLECSMSDGSTAPVSEPLDIWVDGTGPIVKLSEDLPEETAKASIDVKVAVEDAGVPGPIDIELTTDGRPLVGETVASGGAVTLEWPLVGEEVFCARASIVATDAAGNRSEKPLPEVRVDRRRLTVKTAVATLKPRNGIKEVELPSTVDGDDYTFWLTKAQGRRRQRPEARVTLSRTVDGLSAKACGQELVPDDDGSLDIDLDESRKCELFVSSPGREALLISTLSVRPDADVPAIDGWLESPLYTSSSSPTVSVSLNDRESGLAKVLLERQAAGSASKEWTAIDGMEFSDFKDEIELDFDLTVIGSASRFHIRVFDRAGNETLTRSRLVELDDRPPSPRSLEIGAGGLTRVWPEGSPREVVWVEDRVSAALAIQVSEPVDKSATHESRRRSFSWPESNVLKLGAQRGDAALDSSYTFKLIDRAGNAATRSLDVLTVAAVGDDPGGWGLGVQPLDLAWRAGRGVLVHGQRDAELGLRGGLATVLPESRSLEIGLGLPFKSGYWLLPDDWLATSDPLRSVSLSRDGSTAVVVQRDGAVCMIDTASGSLLGRRDFSGSSSPLCAAVGLGGAVLVTGGPDGLTRWTPAVDRDVLEDWSSQQLLPGHPIESVRCSDDALLVAFFTTSGWAGVCHPATEKAEKLEPFGAGRYLCVDPAGDWALAGDATGRVCTRRGDGTVDSLQLPAGGVASVAVSHDGLLVALAIEDVGVVILGGDPSVFVPQPVALLGEGAATPACLAFDADDATKLHAADSEGRLRSWRLPGAASWLRSR